MRTIRTHTELWPLVIVEFDNHFTNEDLVYCCHENAELLRRGEYFCTVRDTRAMRAMPTAVQRRIGAEWQADVGPGLHQWCLGVANVSSSAFMRSLMTAVSWMSPPPTPEALFETIPEAVDWATLQLSEKGIPVSDAIRAYRDRELLKL